MFAIKENTIAQSQRSWKDPSASKHTFTKTLVYKKPNYPGQILVYASITGRLEYNISKIEINIFTIKENTIAESQRSWKTPSARKNRIKKKQFYI